MKKINIIHGLKNLKNAECETTSKLNGIQLVTMYSMIAVLGGLCTEMTVKGAKPMYKLIKYAFTESTGGKE